LISFKKAANLLVVLVPFATNGQSLETALPVTSSSHLRRVVWGETFFPRMGKS